MKNNLNALKSVLTNFKAIVGCAHLLLTVR